MHFLHHEHWSRKKAHIFLIPRSCGEILGTKYVSLIWYEQAKKKKKANFQESVATLLLDNVLHIRIVVIMESLQPLC